jgi:predicted transcriptional regulator
MTSTAVAVKIDKETKKRLQDLAEIKQRSAHWLMREAITQYVERESNRESFRKDAIRAWEEYKDTGLHITGTEIEEWLDTWGTEKEKDVPECHQ